MKKLLTAGFVAASMSVSLFTPTVALANTDLAQNLCEYIASDDKTRLRSFLRDNKVKIRSAYDAVQCNNLSLLGFADSRQSLKAGALIIAKLPKAKVEAEIPSLKTQEMIDAATQRVNG